MKKTIIAAALAIMGSSAYADEVNIYGNDEMNISPVLCQMSYKQQYPSCDISFYSKAGNKIETGFVKLKKMQQYVQDDTNLDSTNFEEDDDFVSNPAVTVYKTPGTKQIRLIYSGSLDKGMTDGEAYGRFFIKITSDGKTFIQNLPVYFETGPDQRWKVDSIKVGTTSISYTVGKKTFKKEVETLTVMNTGNGVFSTSMITFNPKSDSSKYDLNKDFETLNINAAPNSIETVYVFDKKLADEIRAAKGKKVVFLDKQTRGYDEVGIE